MTMQRAIDILRTERKCVERAGTATPNEACDRSCADCDLVLDDKEILEAYTLAIECIEGLMPDVPDNNRGEGRRMMRRTKGEQRAYLDGYEMCADCIEKYLSDEGKQKLSCLLMVVRNAVEVEDIETKKPQPKIGHWIRVDKNKLKCSECEVIHLIAQYPNGKIDWCPNCGAKMQEVQG